MKTIAYTDKLIDLLENVAKEQTGVSICGGKLRQDYGNVLYLTQNRIRANQLNYKLAEEIGALPVKKAAIPPKIIPYTAGFTQLAAMAKFGYVDSLNVCQYSDEWFTLFLCQLAEEVIEDLPFADVSGSVENQRAHLAKDFQVFIRDVIFHLKTGKIATLLEYKEQVPEVERHFLEAYEKYREKEQNFQDTENKFIHPLNAYEYLYDKVVTRAEKTGLKTVVIVENADRLEPLFQAVLERLDCPVYRVTYEPAPENAYLDKTDVYHFMTPLDEAEFVGWKIKSLLSNGTSGTDIGVVCANGKSREVLETVFRRMNIAGEQTLTLAANAYYQLVKMLFGMIHLPAESKISLEAIFHSEHSKFNLLDDFYGFQRVFIKQGIKAGLKPAQALSESIDIFLQKQNLSENTKRVLDDFKQLCQKQPSVLEIAGKSLNDKKDKRIVNDIMVALYELEENLKPFKGQPNYAQKALTLFSVLDRRELNAPREVLLLENVATEQPAENDEMLKQPNYTISIGAPEAAQTFHAEHLLLCGFNAGFDKQALSNYPFALASKLGLPSEHDKKQIIASSISEAMNSAARNYISYPFMSMECKEEGQSAFIKFLRTQPQVKQHIGDGGALLKSYDVIDKQDMPDGSWLATRIETPKSQEFIDFTHDELFKNMTCGEFLREVLKKDEDTQKYSIGTRDFARLIICPRGFIFDKFAEYCGITTDSEEDIQRMTRGRFWHTIFEHAAKQPDFYSADAAQIERVLKQTLEEKITESDIGTFWASSPENFKQDVQQHTFPLFARNEAKRQQKYPASFEAAEQKCTYALNDCDFEISGRIDRIDRLNTGENEQGEQLIFWDYKTGKFKTKKDEANALQLAIYKYIYTHTYPDAKVMTGNIYLNGMDNLPQSTRDEYAELIDNVLKNHFLAFLKLPLDNVPDKLVDRPAFSDKHKYCDFQTICKMIPQGGN